MPHIWRHGAETWFAFLFCMLFLIFKVISPLPAPRGLPWGEVSVFRGLGTVSTYYVEAIELKIGMLYALLICMRFLIFKVIFPPHLQKGDL